MGRAWSAHRELELACKVGSLADFQRALAEGADVNADGGGPMFAAIMKGNGGMVRHLLEAGADPGLFLRKSRLARLKTMDQIVAALMEGAPAPATPVVPPPVNDGDEEMEGWATPPGRSNGRILPFEAGRRPGVPSPDGVRGRRGLRPRRLECQAVE